MAAPNVPEGARSTRCIAPGNRDTDMTRSSEADAAQKVQLTYPVPNSMQMIADAPNVAYIQYPVCQDHLISRG